MADHEETRQSAGFKDRKTGLVIFGILQIILGGLFLLMAPLIILGMVISATRGGDSAASMSPGMMIPSILFYLLMAIWFIWMGIGSIKAQRWARALILVSSWIWLISGISGFILMLLFMPDMYGQMSKNGQMTREAAIIMKHIMTGFMAIFYMIIPGILILFYGDKNVKETCESRDPRIRWTDKCPLPVLAISLIFGIWAISMLFMGFYGWVIPFFGVLLNGIAGAVATLVIMLLLGYVARGTYKLNIKAWRGAVLLTIAWAASMVITFSRVNVLDFYEKMNFPKQQLDAIKEYGILQNSNMIFFLGIWVVGFLGYLLYTRRYFVSSSKN